MLKRVINDHIIACGLALLVVAVFNDVATACPTCREGLAENDPHGQSMAAGYYYSILFMMSMPFIILTTFGSVCYRTVKRAQAQRDAAEK
ncbi:MAG: hypothetical protein JNL18_01170 [Planctomycetaceae bacterium]|uniref:Uncharacterized protein n=1 Tax=Lacipirellula limnantheis TaxID=2528024 RepID=A0A517U318_9BACT|nr:hypothetical protein [Lacipirellula limnantheis]MBL9161329.1 hypothetical protein [Planctomycetaceae bacterium]QDT75011.1 hypothetical protein I41_42190 [Lacipirellula limnantheis]